MNSPTTPATSPLPYLGLVRGNVDSLLTQRLAQGCLVCRVLVTSHNRSAWVVGALLRFLGRVRVLHLSSAPVLLSSANGSSSQAIAGVLTGVWQRACRRRRRSQKTLKLVGSFGAVTRVTLLPSPVPAHPCGPWPSISLASRLHPDPESCPWEPLRTVRPLPRESPPGPRRKRRKPGRSGRERAISPPPG